MVAVRDAAEPRPSTKPEPLGSFTVLFLFTTCTLCALFLLWRRASAIKTVVAHQLTTWDQQGGRIRLSTDDGPSAREFLDDDYDEDNERIGDEASLAATADHLQKAASPALPSADSSHSANDPTLLFDVGNEEPSPPSPPSKP